MKEPMTSTRSRLVVEALVSIYMQEVRQTELLLTDPHAESTFDTFFGNDQALEKHEHFSQHQRITKMLVLATKTPLSNN